MSTPSPEGLPRQPLRFFWHYIWRMRKVFALMFIAFLVGMVCIQSQFYLVAEIVDYTAENFGRDNFMKGALTFAAIFIAVRIVMEIAFRIFGFTQANHLSRLQTMVKADLFAYVQHHSAEYLANNLSGRIGHKINQAATSCEHLVWVITWGFIMTGVILLISSAMLLRTEWFFAAFFLLWGIAYIIGMYFMTRKTRSYSAEYADQQSTVSGRIVDVISNALSVKMFATLKREQASLNKRLQQEFDKGKRFRRSIEWAFVFHGFMIVLQSFVFVGFGVYRLSTGDLTVGDFALIMPLSLQINAVLAELSHNIVWFFAHTGTIDDALGLIITRHNVVDKQGAGTLKVSAGRIEFKNVHFSYRGKSKIFDGLDLTIQPGEKIGLVGESGAGKTSFVHLLLRFYDINKGQILIDGQNIAEVTQDSLRQQIAMIPQDTQLFHRTLYDNIAYGKREATKQDVIRAAKLAHADVFIEAIPEKYDALVGERGIRLSGGQRQRIAIARAILKNAPILILDEATSALDSESEAYIQQSLRELMKDKTVIAVAHRLSTLLNMDRILVFENGKIVEDGKHHELLRRKGLYAKLWSIQSGQFITAAE